MNLPNATILSVTMQTDTHVKKLDLGKTTRFGLVFLVKKTLICKPAFPLRDEKISRTRGKINEETNKQTKRQDD